MKSSPLTHRTIDVLNLDAQFCGLYISPLPIEGPLTPLTFDAMRLSGPLTPLPFDSPITSRGLPQIMFALRVGRWSEKRVVYYKKVQTRGVHGQKIPKNANVICEMPLSVNYEIINT